MGSGSFAPEAGEFSRIFVVKVTSQSVRLLLTVSYGKHGGAGCTTCSPPNNFVAGATAPPAPHVPAQSRAYGLRLN